MQHELEPIYMMIAARIVEIQINECVIDASGKMAPSRCKSLEVSVGANSDDNAAGTEKTNLTAPILREI
jgi:hypothetical protein